MKSLKHLVGVLLFALLLTVSTIVTQAGSVQLAWDANPTNENVTSYVVYYGNASTVYPWQTNAGTNLTVTVTNLAPRTNWYFVVTARNESLESDPSDEIWLTMPDSNTVVRTIGATNMTRTNVALVGVVTNIPAPYSYFFEYVTTPTPTTNWPGGSNVVRTALVVVPSGTGHQHTVSIPVVATNYMCRIIVTNTGFLYYSRAASFRTVPPSAPTQIKFSTTIIQTSSLLSTNWTEVMTASVTKDYPPEGVGFLRSKMNYELITNPPPGELVVVPFLAASSGESGASSPSLQLRTRAKSLSAAPPLPSP